MINNSDKHNSPLRSLDWFTVLLYVLLVGIGWLSICSATYDFGDPDFLSWESRAGKQLVWIACSFGLGFVLLMLDERIYETFSNLIYVAFMVLLFVTPFLASNTKGSYSWLKIGQVSLQPAEFAKCATALAVAKLMDVYGFNIQCTRHFVRAAGLVLLPMLLIIMQHETGSALVYLAFFLMFYREGMPGCFLFAGVAAVTYFVVGVRYDNLVLPGTLTSVGQFVVFTLIWLFMALMARIYGDERGTSNRILLFGSLLLAVSLLFSCFVLPFSQAWVLVPVCLATVGYLVYRSLAKRLVSYFYIALFGLGSLAFYVSSDFILDRVLGDHQRSRVLVLLGVEDDPHDKGYNVNQSKIAIGSGGLEGKGFLNGTQTKLRYVPEQDTDFIFCTVGEEGGFWLSSLVLVLFLMLILRLIYLSERQMYTFGRVYGYSVLSIFLFHVFINVGMVMGLTPVIGIPLPFFSYGGSSLWGFTLLLFIFLRIDADRNRTRD